MKYIDLHVHSNVSDGTLSPKEVVAHGAECSLSAIALTDHDTLSGIKEAQEEALRQTKNGSEIRFIPGVEISVDYKDRDIHMLGLFVDPSYEPLIRELQICKEKRDLRNEKMVQNLVDAGISISTKAMRAADQNSILTRAHFAKYLVDHRYVKTKAEAFWKYLDSTTPYYVKREYLTPDAAISLILSSGGLPVLAHPLLYHFSVFQMEEMIALFREMGLAGIEAYYNSHTKEDEARIISLAGKNNLLLTGGSDFHGRIKPDIEIGVGKGNLKIPITILEQLDACRIAISKQKRYNGNNVRNLKGDIQI